MGLYPLSRKQLHVIKAREQIASSAERSLSDELEEYISPPDEHMNRTYIGALIKQPLYAFTNTQHDVL